MLFVLCFTGVSDGDDVNSYWVIRNGAGKPECKRGEEVKCGSVIRLGHFTTSKNLHSHLFAAPMTGSHQEVSYYTIVFYLQYNSLIFIKYYISEIIHV